MTVLVTGGAGFVGSNLCKELIHRGRSVICVDNLTTGSMRNINSLRDNRKFTFIKGDVKDYDFLDKVFNKNEFSIIFHYAAVVGVKRTIEAPIDVLEDIQGLRNLLQLARNHSTDKFVFSSSSEVYGNTIEIPEREDGNVNGSTPYALGKLVGEKYCEAYHQMYGLRTTALRFFNIFGPRQNSSPYGFVVGIFIKQALKGDFLTILGDGTQTRDFVFIDDNVKAAILAAESHKTDGQVLNIGTGKPTKVIDLAKLIIELIGNSGKIPLKFLPPRPGEILHRFPDVSKMKKLLDFTCNVKLEEGLEKTINWYQKSL